MSEKTRFGVSMNKELLERFDKAIGRGKRSLAIEHLMRSALDEMALVSKNGDVVGVLSLIYNHHRIGKSGALTSIQHRYLDTIVVNSHLHIDHSRCLEVIILRGSRNKVQKAAQELQNVKGVLLGKLILISVEK